MEMYHITRKYSDGLIQTEHTYSIIRALEAAAIYLEDPDCCKLKVYDIVNEKFVVDITRD